MSSVANEEKKSTDKYNETISVQVNYSTVSVSFWMLIISPITFGELFPIISTSL